MGNNKQDNTRGATGNAARISTWGRVALAGLLLSAFAFPARAQQDTDGANRTGDRPDPVIKKDSAPIGAKTKKTDKKTDKKPDNKTAMKSSGRNDDKNRNKSGYVAKRVVLVFPVDATGAAAQQLSDVITDVEKSRLATAGDYGTVSFLSSLPSIRRSITEQSLTQADVTPPFSSPVKAQRLTSAAGYDAAIISSLDSYEYNADNQNVTMVLSIQMIDYSGATPRPFTAADSVTTPPKSVKNATDTTAASEAVRNLTEKLMTNVLKSAMSAKSAPANGTGAKTTTPPAK